MSDYRAAADAMARDCLCFRARRVSRALTRLYDVALRPLNVQASQLSVLNALAVAGDAGAPMSVLADVLVMDRSTLSRNLRPLEAAGYLRVARAPHDARTRIVILMPAGQRLVAQALPLWRQVHEQVTRAVGARTAGTLREQLDGVVDAVLAADAAPAPPARRARRSATAKRRR